MRQTAILPMLAAGLLLGACNAPDPRDAEPATTPTPAPATAATPISFRCGDLLVGVEIDPASDAATVSWSGHRRRLARTANAPNGYADADGTAFRSDGDDARFAIDGAAPLPCSATDETSPWDDARNRGVSLRAIGNEPGWLAEILPGDPPALKAQLDYGERLVEVAALSKDEALPGYSGSTADGVEVSLRYVEGACSDGMSDQSYPASVRLTVGAETFDGCGALLFP